MADFPSNLVCLHLLCPALTEERVLDALLAVGEAGVFTSSPASGHGYGHGALSTQDQVSGRSDAAVVQVLVAHDQLDALLSRLQPELVRTGARYWATPVVRQGEFK